MRRLGGLSREDGVDQRKHHLTLALARVRKRVAHEMHSAGLRRRVKDLRDPGLQSDVRVGDDELRAAQSTPR